MKILHVCLASHYTEGMTYQDNQLPDQNVRDGHEVIVVSDCYQYKAGELVEVPEQDLILSGGVRLIRLKYDRVLNKLISSKVRKVSRLYGLLVSESPDVILFHGVAGWEMLAVARYKRACPQTKLYMDSHEDFHNSGTFWVSRFFQYRLFNRFLVSRVKSEVDKFLYLSYESKDFLSQMYGLKDENMEFYPLGGNIIPKEQKLHYSKLIRARHGFDDDDILILHSGKLDAAKKTVELIKAFLKVGCSNLKLLVVGSIPDNQKSVLEPLFNKSPDVFFLGWKTGDELVAYLCAADLYFQPGTQSATMQNAICCGTPVALYPYASHRPYIRGNGYFVSSCDDYVRVFEALKNDKKDLASMSDKSYLLAYELLDYKVLAGRLYR